MPSEKPDEAIVGVAGPPGNPSNQKKPAVPMSVSGMRDCAINEMTTFGYHIDEGSHMTRCKRIARDDVFKNLKFITTDKTMKKVALKIANKLKVPPAVLADPKSNFVKVWKSTTAGAIRSVINRLRGQCNMNVKKAFLGKSNRHHAAEE